MHTPMQTRTPNQEESWFTRLLTLPSLEIARFTIFGYMRSGWILLDIVLTWLIFSVFFSASSVRTNEFFSLASPGMAAEAVVSSIIITHRAMRANSYLPLSRLSSRAPYLYGIMLAASVARIPLYGLLLLTTLIGSSITDMTWLNMLSGSFGLLLICTFCALITVTLSKPIATRLARIIFLSWIILALYAVSPLTNPIRQYFNIVQVPLQPIALCYQFGVQGFISGWGWFGAALLILYMGLVVFIAKYWFAKRDLPLF